MITWIEPNKKRKRLVIRLPEYKPEPERPPRTCRVCDEERRGWQFATGGHPDVCGECAYWRGRGLHAHGLSHLTPDDRSIFSSAEAVVRRLSRGS